MVENKLVIPDEMMQYLNQSILGTESVAPAKTDSINPEPEASKDTDSVTKDTSENQNTNNSSDKISDVATSDDSLLKNLGAIGSDLNISDIPVDLRSLDVSMSGNSGSLLTSKSPDDKNTPLQEQVIPEVTTEACEKEFSKPASSNVPANNPLQSLQTMAANQTEQSNRMRVNNPLPQKQNPAMSPKTMVMSPQNLAHNMLSPQSLPHSAMSPQSVMSPHNMPHSVMSPASVYNVMSPQSVMSVMSPQHNAMSPQSMQSLMSPQMPNQIMMSPRHTNIGSPMSQNMASPMVNMASPMTQNIASPMSHGMNSPMHPGLQSPMAQGMTSPMVQNIPNMAMNAPVSNQNQNMMININHQSQMAVNMNQQQMPPNYMNNRQNCNSKMPNKNFNNLPNQYPNQNFNQPSSYPVPNPPNMNMRNQQQNMQQYQMMQQFNQNQMPMPMQNQNMTYNQMNYPQQVTYPNPNQIHPLQMSRSSVMSVDNSGNMLRGAINSYCENQGNPPIQNMQYNQNMQYPQPPPYNSVVNAANVMGPPPPKNNHQYNQAMMNNNQYYNHQRPYNQWDYPGNQFNKHNMQKSVQNSVNMSTGSQKPNGSRVSMNQIVKTDQQTDCSMNSLRSNNQVSDVQVWDISQSQIEATNGRKKNQNTNNTMRQETYQRTLEYVENCENWKSSEMVSSSTHPLQGGDNMVVNDLQTSLSSFYEENQYLQMIQ